MNIKIIYDNKIKALPSATQTLADIRSATKKQYPMLPDRFFLFVQIDPNSELLTLVDSEDQFDKVKQVHQDMQWQSIKLLVQKDMYDDHNQEDLSRLNQSMFINKSKAKRPEQQQDNNIKQCDETREQEHQLPQDVGLKNIDSSVLLKDLNLPGVDKQVFQNYLIQLIDQRLMQLGIIDRVVERQKLEVDFTQSQGSQFDQECQKKQDLGELKQMIKSIGKDGGRKQSQDQEQELYKLEQENEKINSEKNQLDLEREKRRASEELKSKLFNQELEKQLNIQKEKESKRNDKLMQKAQELQLLFPQLQLNDLYDFIERDGGKSTLDDIVEQILASQ